jgi:hypothetical protein
MTGHENEPEMKDARTSAQEQISVPGSGHKETTKDYGKGLIGYRRG